MFLYPVFKRQGSSMVLIDFLEDIMKQLEATGEKIKNIFRSLEISRNVST